MAGKSLHFSSYRPRVTTGTDTRPTLRIGDSWNRHGCANYAHWLLCAHCSGYGRITLNAEGDETECPTCAGEGGEFVCEYCLSVQGSSSWRGPRAG